MVLGDRGDDSDGFCSLRAIRVIAFVFDALSRIHRWRHCLYTLLQSLDSNLYQIETKVLLP